MVSGQFKFKAKVDQKVLGEAIANSDIQKDYEDALLEVAGELQSNTPIGATGKLKAGWDVDLNQKLIGSTIRFEGSISNTANYAQFGVIGRGPGKPPPIQPIEDWVRAKGFVNPDRAKWAVRAAIARRGTIRWRRRQNWVGLNRDGSLQENSPLNRLRDYLQRAIDRP